MTPGSPSILSASTSVCLFVIATVVLLSESAPRRSKRGENNDFYFVEKPLINHVENGHAVRLRCVVNKKQHIQYHWTLDRKALVSTSRRYQDGSDLYISNADRDLDGGIFRCVATNTTSKFSMESKGYVVKVYWMDPDVSVRLVRPARLDDIRVGSEVELQCKTSAHPPVNQQQISWYHNFQKLKGQAAKAKDIVVLPNGNLRIRAFQRGNAGVYRCLVIHPAGLVMTNRPLAIATNDDSSLYKVSLNPDEYLQYFRRRDVMKLKCPVSMSPKAVGFINWAYRARLDLNSDLKSFEYFGNCKQPDCVLSKAESFVLRRQPSRGQSWTGFYSCQLILANNTMSKKYVVEVRRAENPSLNASNFGLRHSAEKVVPVAGKSFTIRVYVDLTKGQRNQQIVADPKPKFQWFTPSGRRVPYESADPAARIRIVDGHNLLFSRVLDSDSGTFRFTATNADGLQEGRVHVIVAFPPRLKPQPMKDVKMQEGPTNVSLRCNVAVKSLFPIAEVQWTKDGQAVLSHRGRIEINRKEGILRFVMASLQYSGLYRCVVKTRGLPDVESNKFRIRVMKRLRITVPDPQPFMERGLSAKLTCLASGEPPLRFKWFRADPKTPGRMITIETNSARYQTEREGGGKGVLRIQMVKDEDAGEYMCRATDGRGASSNITYRVVVGENPIIRHSTSANISTVEGQQIQLDCKATGDPTPKTSWIRRRTNKDTESLTLETFADADRNRARRYLFDNGTLLIRNAEYEDEGVYQCVVGHKHAMVSGPDVHVRVALLNGGSPGDRYRRRSPLTKTILIVVGCALAYLGLIIALTVYCSIRMMKKRMKYSEAVIVYPGTKADMAAAAAAESQRLMSNGEYMPHGTLSGGQISPSASLYNKPFGAPSAAGSMVDPTLPPYPRGRLITVASLGKGEFGEVLLARAPLMAGPNECGETEVLVTIKSLQSTKERRFVDDFLAQMEMFNKLDHRSVARLIGTCLEAEPSCFLLEYCAWGDLKQFLRAIRKGHLGQPLVPSMTTHVGGPDSPSAQPLSHSQRMHICSQVANGMEHISNLRFVHKDLAARNILLSPNLDVKISNLGLCQSVYAEDYFPLRYKGSRRTRPVPIRWMPPEVILNGGYSPETDVWSFGIFVYEVLSLGETPLRKHSHSEILSAAAAHRLSPELPPNCSPELQSLLLRCWSQQPGDRPSFSEISVLVGGMVVECDV